MARSPPVPFTTEEPISSWSVCYAPRPVRLPTRFAAPPSLLNTCADLQAGGGGAVGEGRKAGGGGGGEEGEELKPRCPEPPGGG